MTLVRTNITLPDDLLRLVDEVAGPRGRSRYIAEVVARQVRRDRARAVFERSAGALAGSTTWGRTPAERQRVLAGVRRETDRRDRPDPASDDGAASSQNAVDGPLAHRAPDSSHSPRR
jgi:hypothetical protein